MKTSNKIIITVTAFSLAVFFICLLILRNDIQHLIFKDNKKYENANIKSFKGLDFSSNWDVKIIQGQDYNIEFSTGNDSTIIPNFKNINDTLYFTINYKNSLNKKGIVHAKITAPKIRHIKAVKGSKIFIKSFKIDSLNLVLENMDDFKGKNNQIKYLSVNSSGKSNLEFIVDDQSIN